MATFTLRATTHTVRRTLRHCLPGLLTIAALPSVAHALPALADVQQLAVGESHACVLTTAGGVKCWGSNDYGQLGDGSLISRYLPVNVVGLSGGVSAISLGYRHSCALLADGSAKCWGKNLLSQLGDGTSTGRRTPVTVQGLSGATAISAGGDHTCALRGSSGLSCWGYNGDGQIGNGNTSTQPLPVSVPGGQDFVAISTGYSNTCAITTSATVKCWGVFDRVCNNFGCGFSGQLSPATIAGLSGVTQISSGQYFNCAVVAGGAVKCWGDNYYHQLGDLGTTNPNPLTLYDIVGLGSGVTMVSAGYKHACARLSDGSARCWGDNGSGKLGDGSNTDGLTPVVVAGLTNATSIGAGGSHSCARTTGGGVKCWGSNGSGQLGDNDPWFRLTPVGVPGLGNGVQSIAAGEFHSCAVTASGAVKCWGANSTGQIGNGGTLEQATAVNVSGLASGMSSVSAGAAHSCALSSGGAVKCWGRNDSGQLGDASFDQRLTPVQVSGLTSGITSVDAGDYHSCARTHSGAAKCWGQNSDSQLGDASLTDQSAPVSVANLASGVISIGAGGYHSCAVVAGGKIACWGSNNEAQIGDGTYDTAYIPVIPGYPDQGSTAISAGGTHSCAVVDGRVLCWGGNSDGQCGNGYSSGNITEPSLIGGLASVVTAISAGRYHSCAIGAGGQAFCWGNNGQGEIGDASTVDRPSPTAVAGLESGVTRISAGGFHSCALTSGGIVKCWGDNSSGQLGIGRRNGWLPGDVLEDRDSIFRSGFEISGI
ncbi:MAG TPA: hypothetical protein VFN13_01290 [Rudaea sp.]|nr:hypothetical protein [Rudaea sp.]